MNVTNEKVVKIAIYCNIIILTVKSLAAWLSGSSALFSEMLHSLSDTMNASILLVGIRLALKKPDKTHPLGYSRAIYFWSLISGVFMFGVIASTSMVRGYMQISEPYELKHIEFAIVSVLFVIGFEIVAAYYAYNGLYATYISYNGKKAGLIETFRKSRDPAVKLTFVEDCMSLSSGIIALVGLVLVYHFGMHQIDGYAALSIGFILAVMALYLINENRKKILGESAGEEIEMAIRRHALADTDIKDIVSLKTVQFGANKVMAYLVVEIDPDVQVEDLDDITFDLERRIIRGVPEVIDCFIEVVADEGGPTIQK